MHCLIFSLYAHPAAINNDDGKIGEIGNWRLEQDCDNDSFQCKNGDCMPKRWLCDGVADLYVSLIADCPSGDDERNYE